MGILSRRAVVLVVIMWGQAAAIDAFKHIDSIDDRKMGVSPWLVVVHDGLADV